MLGIPSSVDMRVMARLYIYVTHNTLPLNVSLLIGLRARVDTQAKLSTIIVTLVMVVMRLYKKITT